jgi:simple sugar transport system ATP-binding protein
VKLELRGITKRFGDLVACDGISITVEAGQIHALLGENGAGKSTLMNVVYGLLQPDGGEILVDDKPLVFRSPSDSIAAGIGMVHQHFMLVPVFTVAENVELGDEKANPFGVLKRSDAIESVREVSKRYGLEVDPTAIVEELPVGVQQRVEIIKALTRNVDTLILDEPTAVLTPQETDELLEIMRQLKAAGKGIVFITHKLREVREAADVITVIRRGRVVAEAVSPQTSEQELASLMVGRDVKLTVDKLPASLREPIVRVENLSVLAPDRRQVVSDATFEIRGGEVLVIAGVQGNGQSELVQALVGLEEHVTGSAKVDEHETVGLSTHKILNLGVGYVPEDRELDGLVASASISENLVLDMLSDQRWTRNGVISPAKLQDNAVERIEQFDIRTQGPASTAGSLSGGNKQKVVLARELSRPLRLLIAAQPTRGLDVGSIEFVHKRILQERDNGAAVIIAATELDEVYALADRIAVMYRGRIVDIVDPSTPAGELGLLMAGATGTQAQAPEPPPTDPPTPPTDPAIATGDAA